MRTHSFHNEFDGSFVLRISRGHIDGTSNVNKFGYNPSIGTVEETVWDAGGLYPWPTEALQMSVVSTDANDTSGGTGARSVILFGLDADYNRISEVVILNGLSPVLTSQSFLRVYRMSVITGGTTAGSAGNILASNAGTTYAQILNGNNQTLMAVYTIPAGYNGYLMFGKISVGAGKDMTVKMYVKPFGGVFNLAHAGLVYENSYDYEFFVPLKIPEKTDIDVRGISSSSGVKAAAVFDLILVKE